jgi:choice-of-anchor B domain-containing protein
MVDVANPKEPRFAGCFSEDGYTHDVQCVSYDGPDADYRGREICFASNEDTLTVVDVTDKSGPRLVSRTSYQGVGYIHQTWVTRDRLFLLMDDELDEQYFGHNTSTRIWDIADLDHPAHIGSHVADTEAIDHNLYIRDGLVYQANYRAGLRILRLDRIAEGRLEPAGFFDIYPADDAPEFNGAWSAYPFFPSGVVAVSGIEQGLFLLKPEIR